MKRVLKQFLEKPELAGVLLLLLLCSVFDSSSAGNFLSLDNGRAILGVLPEIGLIVIGVTILMIAGEFDLSVGSVFALMPMIIAVLMQHQLGFFPAFACGILAAALVGLVNGYITITFGIPSFITTLGMLFMARSLTIVISGGFPPPLSEAIPTGLFTAFWGPAGLFRASFIWFIGVAVLAWVMLTYSNFGNWIRATGGFLPAAESMGIRTRTVKIACFMLCSVLAGCAGFIQVVRLGSPLPSMGEGLELQAVAASVIGGTSLLGGVGTILGGIVGALLIRTIDNGLVVTGVDANWFQFAIGALTIVAVVANAAMRKRGRKIKLESQS